VKKVAILGLILILLSSIAIAQDTGNVPFPQITFLSQDPDPVEPGEVFDVRIKAENLGGAALEDVEFEVVEEYPFSVYTGDKKEFVARLDRTRDNSKILKWTLKVDEDAVEGITILKVRYTVKGQFYEEKEFDIQIRTRDAVLAITSVKTVPEKLVPGETGKLQLELTSFADSVIRDIRLKLDLESELLPLVPIGGTTETRIYKIEGGESATVEYNIQAQPDADSKLYKVPIELSYADPQGNSYNKSDLIGIDVGTIPDLLVTLTNSEIISEETSGIVTIQLANAGLTDIKFMKLRLAESDDYEILSSAEIYIGDVDSDDTENQDFTLFVKETTNLKIVVEYRDANNREYTENYNVPLKVFSNKEAKALGIQTEGKGSTIIIIILLIIGFLVYRKFKKKKSRK